MAGRARHTLAAPEVRAQVRGQESRVQWQAERVIHPPFLRSGVPGPAAGRARHTLAAPEVRAQVRGQESRVQRQAERVIHSPLLRSEVRSEVRSPASSGRPSASYTLRS